MADDKKLLFKTAYLYFQEGRWDKAIVEFKRLAALDPEDLTARNMLGDAYMKKGLMREAYEEYAYSAEGYSKKGEPEKANAIYKKMSKLEVNNLDAAQQKKVRLIALVVRGDQAYEAGNYEDASQAYQEVVNIDPAQMDVVAKLAEIYTRLGRNKEAAIHWFGAARFYMDNRLFKRALIYFQKVVELEPGNIEARLALGELLAREGQELEARKEFQAIADIYISQNQLDKAQQCCQKAIALKSIDAHWQLGEIFIRRSQWDDARTELDAFLKIKANHVPAQYSLGVVLLNKNLYDEAIAQFGKILGRQPDHVESLERMAEIYEKKGATRDAVVQRVALGRVFVGQRILDRAEATFRLALEVDPAFVEARRQLGEVLEMRGMRKEAGEAYLAALASAREQKLGTEIAACEAKLQSLDPALLGDAGGAAAPVAEASSIAPPTAVMDPSPALPDIAPASLEIPVAAAPAAPPLPPPIPVMAPAPVTSPPAMSRPAAGAPPPPPPMPTLAAAPKAAPRAVPPAAVPAAAPKAAPLAAFDPLPAAAAPVRAKAALTPQQRAQRLVSMATSALRQGSYDEALDMLEQAKTLVPDDAELKDKVQAVLVEYASKSAGRRPIPGMAGPKAQAAAPAPAAAVAPASATVAEAAPLPSPVAAAPKAAETAVDIERRLREQIEKEYSERRERSTPEAHADTREQVLARAGAPDEPASSAAPLPRSETPAPTAAPLPRSEAPMAPAAPALTPPPPPAYHRADEPPRVVEPLPASESAIQRPEPVPAVVGAGAGSEPVRARPRVSYV